MPKTTTTLTTVKTRRMVSVYLGLAAALIVGTIAIIIYLFAGK